MSCHCPNLYFGSHTCCVSRDGCGLRQLILCYLVANAVLAGCQTREDRWAYGIPFAAQLIFLIIILVLLPFCPESPWWLARREEFEEAERSLKKTYSRIY
jgi:hypothetical protein